MLINPVALSTSETIMNSQFPRRNSKLVCLNKSISFAEAAPSITFDTSLLEIVPHRIVATWTHLVPPTAPGLGQTGISSAVS